MKDATKSQQTIQAGVFSTLSGADRAVEQLLAAGFTKEEVTVVCSDKVAEAHFKPFEHQEPAGSHTPAAAATGGAIGAALGGLAALAGAATGGLAFLAAGGIALWAGGMVGGLVGAMMTRGVERELANFYNQAVSEGKILVAAENHREDEPQRLALARRILSDAGAEPMTLPEG